MALLHADDRFPPVPTQSRGETIPSPLLFDLAGKTALVTGGNGGIGGGMARGLAEAGADIIIIQVPGEKSPFPQQLAADTLRRVDTYDCDLSSSEAIRLTVKTIIERDQRTVDILCNIAGISGGFVPIFDETDEHRELVSFSSELFAHSSNSVNRCSKFIIMPSTSCPSSLDGTWPSEDAAGR